MTQKAERTGQSEREAILIGFLLTILLGSILVARRNLRLGRGDRVGASRLALFVVIASLLAWVFSAHHVPTLFEFGLFVLATGWSLFLAGIIWLVYIAVEPYLRKHWPHALISWNRLLAGRVRDPLVGRDLLVGSAIGVLFSAGVHAQSLGVTWFGAPPPEPISNQLDSLLGVGYIVAAVLRDLSANVFFHWDPSSCFFSFDGCSGRSGWRP